MQVKLLEGKLSREEAQELKEILRIEKEKGNRWAVVPTEKDPIMKGDLTFYSSVFDAWKYIEQKPIDEGIHVFRSVVLLQDEVERVLGIKQAWAKKQQQESKEKPSHKRRLSR